MGDGEGNGSTELDILLLKERRKLLYAAKMDSQLESQTSTVTLGPRPDVKLENEDVHVQGVPSVPSVCCTKEHEAQLLVHEQDNSGENHTGFQSGIPSHVLKDSTLEQCAENASYDQNQTVNHMNFDRQETHVNTYPDVQLNVYHTIQNERAMPSEKVEIDSWSSTQNPSAIDVPPTSIVNNFTLSLCSNPKDTSSSTEIAVTAVKMEKESPDNFDDVLDHFVLRERQKMLLLKRNSLKLADSGLEQGSSASSSWETREKSPATGIEESQFSVNDILTRKFLISGPTERETSVFVPQTTSANENIAISILQPEMMKSMNTLEIQQSKSTMSAEGIPIEFSPYGGESAISSNKNALSSSEGPASFNIKDEPWDSNELHLKENAINLFPVKTEPNVSNEIDEDQVEDISLLDRVKSLSSGKDSSSTGPANYASASMSAQPVGIKHLRKRKKTATDSIETALEEDVPGLLQILMEKGVLVDEIKLFGETESDEALDESLCTDSFADLEAVMSKLFSQRHSFLKFASVRCTKASRANYCLACLISLVEQSRYLQFRKLPVEWGWCRDLQSFIFVFEKHNRLVLERPEYGYATYFFELLNSLPIDWQIKRLVITMKLSSFSRISLIENKALMVGEDLTEGEARVLAEYGWVPNTGLGTMLNYCDRVVHNRYNEDTSEWRSKIGKLLVDGYNGGTMVAPKKVIDSSCMQEQDIKLETD